MIKAILYDLDGVLVDACDWHYEALNKALNDVCGYEISRKDHLSIYNGLPTRVKLQKLMELDLFKEDQVDRIFELKQQYTIATIKKYAIKDEEKLQLHEYTRSLGIRSACVTNSIRTTATLMLERTGQIEYMEFLICNEDTTPKPSPEPYLLAMNKMGVSKNDVLIFEDSEKGYESAKSSGAWVARVPNATHVNIKRIPEQLLA